MIIKANGYDIIIEKGCLDRAGDYLPADRKTLVVTDSGVPAEYAKKVLSFCGEGSLIKTIPLKFKVNGLEIEERFRIEAYGDTKKENRGIINIY